MVLVSHQHQFVFLKTSKTAGTSVEMFLQSLCVTEDALPITEQNRAFANDKYIVGCRRIAKTSRTELDKKWFNHMTAAAVRAELGNDVMDKYRIVTSVRNPFDLVISRFYWNQNNNGAQLPDNPDAHIEAFGNFVHNRSWPNSRDIVFESDQFVPTDLIRFESLDNDLDSFMSSLKISSKPALLPKTKQTLQSRQNLSIADYYQNDTIGIVQEHMAWLIKDVGYSSQPPN